MMMDMATPSSSVSEAIVASTEGDKTDSEHTSPRPTDSKEDVQGKILKSINALSLATLLVNSLVLIFLNLSSYII